MEAGNTSRSRATIALTIVTTATRSIRLVSGRGPPVLREATAGRIARVPPSDQGCAAAPFHQPAARPEPRPTHQPNNRPGSGTGQESDPHSL